MDRRKELKEKYKQMKPNMGIYMVKSKTNKKCFLEATKNLDSRINRAKFALELSAHENRELQKEWKEQGEDSFVVEVLELLEYDKDESKTDYSEELALLQMIWEEKMIKDNISLYKR